MTRSFDQVNTIFPTLVGMHFPSALAYFWCSWCTQLCWIN